jgi:hypothetical protein
MKKKSRKHRHHKKRKNKTIKIKRRIIASETPIKIRKISNNIARKLLNKSYSPTINQELITLQSIPRNELNDCNIEEAYKLKEPLKIGISGSLYGKSCFEYDTKEAKRFLLRNLAADKHIDPKKIVPPIQSQSNCWFNAMFATFFISDKGRKFFHFFRQLMIEGKQKNGEIIPKNIRDAFALLNFGIDACLTGNKFAYLLNTNTIIHQLYKSIPKTYKKSFPSIVDVDEAGNPLLYYIGIINYLNDNSIILLFIRDADIDWKDRVSEAVSKLTHMPHIIVLEIFDKMASKLNKKPVSFTVDNAKFEIDSAVVRDISRQHFCATIMCEGQEMGYDGMSYHRLVPLDWKHKMNTDYSWQFEGTTDYDGTPLEWNFTKSYQLLLYYRVQ